MRLQENTLPTVVNLTTPSIELGNTSIHTAYALEVEITATNNTGSAVTPTIDQFLGVLENISIVSDSTRYHYSVSGMDIARRNAMKTKTGVASRVFDMEYTSVADDEDVTANFVLMLEEGDVIALMHDSVTLKATFGRKLDTDFGVVSAKIQPTIFELVPSASPQVAEAELIARYGQGFAGALEPKVYALEATCPANTEVMGFFNLPTGALLRGGMLHWTVAPSQFGLIATVPSRSELMRLNWAVARAKDERRFGTTMPEGVVNIDYDAELTLNGLGIDGRAFNRGDYQISARTADGANSTKLRYVSYEMMYPSVADGALNTGHNMF